MPQSADSHRTLYDLALELLDRAIAEPREDERLALMRQASVLFREYVRAMEASSSRKPA
jgi:hypothetical protein